MPLPSLPGQMPTPVDKPIAVVQPTTPILVRRLTADAVLPRRGTGTAAGLDLYSTGDWTLPTGVVVAISTGIALALPVGTVGLVCDRSGLGLRGITTRVGAVNRVALLKWIGGMSDDDQLGYIGGVIDDDYRGELRVLLINTGPDTATIKKGDRVAQLVILSLATTDSGLVNVREVDDLPPSDRGTGGFGSTGR